MSLPYTSDQRRAANTVQARIHNARVAQRDAKHNLRLARLEFMCAKAIADAQASAQAAEAEVVSFKARVEILNRRGRHDGP